MSDRGRTAPDRRPFGAGGPRSFYDRRMSLEWEQTIVDAQDPGGLGSWWREALGWVVVNDDPAEFEICRRPAWKLPSVCAYSLGVMSEDATGS